MAFSSLRVNYIGIRSGEYITSSPEGKQCIGSIMRIRGNYPPARQLASQLELTTLRDTLSKLPFFAPLSTSARQAYLLQEAIPNHDLYLEDCPGLAVHFLQISGAYLTKTLGSAKIDMLLQGNPNDPEGYWPLREVIALFPFKIGSKARKSTLVFRPSNWTLMEAPVDNHYSTFSGLFVDLDNLTSGIATISGRLTIIELPHQRDNQLQGTSLARLAIKCERGASEKLTYAHVQKLCSKYHPIARMDEIQQATSWFAPSMYKSLLQKVIRTRCQSVIHDSQEDYHPLTVLLSAFCSLVSHPGAFVPNIQRYVTGLESAGKRSAVTIVEDSSISDPRVLLNMYASALLAQSDKSYIPSDQQLELWIKALIEAQSAPQHYRFDIAAFAKLSPAQQVIRDSQPLSLSYLILQRIRSFQSDIDMLGSIAHNEGSRVGESNANRTIMPLFHSLDHHSYTEIALFYPYQAGLSYAEFFRLLWTAVVSSNPRRGDNTVLSGSMVQPLIYGIQSAQIATWLSKSRESRKLELQRYPRLLLNGSLKKVELSYSLPTDWLAGLVGTMEVKLNGYTAIVVLRPDDIYSYSVIKRARREDKAHVEFSDEEKLQVIEIVQAKLRSTPLLCKRVPESLAEWAGCSLQLLPERSATATATATATAASSYKKSDHAPASELNERWCIQLQGQAFVPFEEARHMLRSFEVAEALQIAAGNEQDWWNRSELIEEVLDHNDNCVVENAEELFTMLLTIIPLQVLRRSITYINTYSSSIELYKISRDGSGQNYAVRQEDTGVNHLLYCICRLYSAALQPTSHGFVVKCGALMWSIRDRIRCYIASNSKFSSGSLSSSPPSVSHSPSLPRSSLSVSHSSVPYSSYHSCPSSSLQKLTIRASSITNSKTIKSDKILSPLSPRNSIPTLSNSASLMLKSLSPPKKWAVMKPDARKMWEHQSDCVKSMMARQEKGIKGNILWVTLGLGKTLIVSNYIREKEKRGLLQEIIVWSMPASAIDSVVRELAHLQQPINLLDMRMSGKNRKLLPYHINILDHDHMRLNGMDEQLREHSGQILFVLDEFHKCLGLSIRTSIALEIAKLSGDFVALSGTIVKDDAPDELIAWLAQVSEFEVSEHNYYVAIGGIVSKKTQTNITVLRESVAVEMSEQQLQSYNLTVPERLGGSHPSIDLVAACSICYEVVSHAIVQSALHYLRLNEGVFIVARNKAHQLQLYEMLRQKGLSEQAVHLISKQSPITLDYNDQGPVRVVITTIDHNSGYTLSKFGVTLQSVYFSNQMSRDQLDGRTNRIGNLRESIVIVTYHSGVLSYINERYEKCRKLSESLKDFAKSIDLQEGTLLTIA